jgi:polysaccharide biosynthesis/export protein
VIAFFRSFQRYGVWFCGLALLTIHLSGYSQSLPASGDSPAVKSEMGKLFGGKLSAPPTGDLFFEGPINPADYLVGPGDRLNIVFWLPTYSENTVTINGEGDVIIPYVGRVGLANLSLKDARERIEAEVSRALRIGSVTVSLAEPRKFRVHVTGLVETPGTYVVPATGRVSDAITMAGGLKRERVYTHGDTASVVIASQRQIELLDPDGKRAGHADMLLFERGGMVKANPYLRDGQTVHVPYPSGATREIGVYGAVHAGGRFEFAEGDGIDEVLALAGGMIPNADSTSLAVVSEDGKRLAINLKDPANSDPVFQPGDRLYVSAFPDTSRAGSVSVTGEVARPGGYPIISGQTTLREVLDASGGLLPTASAPSARLIRKTRTDPAEPERSRVIAAGIGRLADISQLGNQNMDPQLAAEFARWDYGTVVLDLSDATVANNSAGDLRLQDGDVLEVPKTPMGVRVLGAVNQAGEVAWEPGQNLNHYLDLAGGVNKRGYKSRATIIKARNGSQLRYQSSLTIDPGDVIFIPRKPDVSWWETAKDIVAVTSQVVTVVLVIQNVKK